MPAPVSAPTRADSPAAGGAGGPREPGGSGILRQPKSVWAVEFASVIAFMGIGLVDPILQPIASQLDASPSHVSLLFTSYMAVTSPGSSPAGSGRSGPCSSDSR